MAIKIQYGLLNNELVHVDSVPKGLACNCVCPSCKRTLVARKGDKTTHHFAHYNNNQCDTAYETTLHILAKEILKESKKIQIPPVYIGLNNIMVSDEYNVDIDKVELEKRINDIIPDIVIYARNNILLLEVYVTHKLNTEKIAKIKEYKYSTIQIDLSHLDRHISKEELTKILIDSSKYKSWIYNKYQEYKELEKRSECLKLPIISKYFLSFQGEENGNVYVRPCPKARGKSRSILKKYCQKCNYLFATKDNYIYCSYKINKE